MAGKLAIFFVARRSKVIQIQRPRAPLRVWWKKCGTQNDSSAGSRPGRQARGGRPEISFSDPNSDISRQKGLPDLSKRTLTIVVPLHDRAGLIRFRHLSEPQFGNAEGEQ